MKKVLLSLSLLAFAFQSCNKIKDKIAENFKWDGEIAVIKDTVEIGVLTNTDLVGTIATSENIPFSLDAELRKVTKDAGYEVGVDKIKTARLESMKLTLIDGDGVTTFNPDADNNFANFEQCHASFLTNTNPTAVTITEIVNNADVYSTSLTLPTNNTELKSYLNASTASWVILGKLRRPTTKKMRVVVEAKMHVEVDLGS